jgi:hypothetical protein
MSDEQHAAAPDVLCADCGHPKNTPAMHFEAPGDNWGAALHNYRPVEQAPDAVRELSDKIIDNLPREPSEDRERSRQILGAILVATLDAAYRKGSLDTLMKLEMYLDGEIHRAQSQKGLADGRKG